MRPKATERRAVTAPVKDVRGAEKGRTFGAVDVRPARATSPRALPTTAEATRRGDRAPSATAPASSDASDGIGSGSQGVSGGGTGAISGVRSKSPAISSAPDTPSMAAWWMRVTAAMRPPSRPSTTCMSHSGRARSSGRPASSPTRVSSWAREPGAGSADRCRWASRSKSGSSIHTGWAVRKGTSTRRRRNGGSRWSRSSSRRRTSANGSRPSRLPGSSTRAPVTCMWVDGVSR